MLSLMLIPPCARSPTYSMEIFEQPVFASTRNPERVCQIAHASLSDLRGPDSWIVNELLGYGTVLIITNSQAN